MPLDPGFDYDSGHTSPKTRGNPWTQLTTPPAPKGGGVTLTATPGGGGPYKRPERRPELRDPTQPPQTVVTGDKTATTEPSSSTPWLIGGAVAVVVVAVGTALVVSR